MSGEGDNTSVYIYNGVDKVPNDVTHVRVDPSVTIINGSGFACRQRLEEVDLPEGLIQIGEFAFFHCCKSLKRINFPSTVKEIGSSAFFSCHKLVELVLPDGLQRLGEGVFSHCKSLKRINVPPGIKKIAKGTFGICESLTDVVFSEGLEEIGEDAFSSCKSLVSVTLPSSLRIIGKTSFHYSCLNDIHMPDSVQTIDDGAFYVCNFQNFRTPPLVNRFDMSILADNESLVSLELSENVKDITDTKELYDPDFNDADMKSLRNIALPSECTTSAALDGCEDLEEALFDEDLVNTLKHRFDDLPIHKICYYQSYHDNESTLQSLKQEFNELNVSGKEQDCLGMTPLHILACSTKPTIEMYRLLIDKYPETLIMKDKWGDIPLLYAIWCNAPTEVVDLLVESYKSNHPDYEFDWSGMLLKLANRKLPLKNIQNLVNTQRNSFPEQKYDMQVVVMKLTKCTTSQSGYIREHSTIETVRYLIQASIRKRLDSLDVKRFQVDMENSINTIEKKGREEDTRAVYDRLAAYEIAKEATSVLELALWKTKIDKGRNKRARVSGEDISYSYREQCRMNCGADIIIRNVLHHLLPKEITIPSYQPITQQATSQQLSNEQERNGIEEYQIQKWLLSSTTLLLGDELTFQLINGEANATSVDTSAFGMISNNRQQQLDNFDTKKEYRKHAISTMQSWCQWIIQCSTGRQNSRRRRSSTSKYQLTYGSIKCSPVNAAKIVDSILYSILNIPDLEEGVDDTELGREGNTALLELIHIAIIAWSNCKNRDGTAVNRTEYWLQLLQERQTNFADENDMRLYEECYRGVIRACISSHEYQHLEKAIGLLDDMRDEHHRLYPTAQTCNLVLYGLANCKPSTKNAKQAEDILKNMIHDCQENELKYAYRPDTNTFRQVITAWTKSEATDEAAKNARRILDQMLTDYPQLDPDASTFNAIMTLYLQLGRRKEALAMFDQMCSLQQSGRKGTKPDLYSINLMLNALSKQPPFCSSEELQKAEDVLDVIRESFNVAPDVQSYNILIDSWAKSNLPESAEKAVLLLDIMERRCRLEPSIAPDCYTYTSVINAISKSKHHKRRGSWAEEIFQRMKTLYSQGIVNEPTVPVYNALLNALITSDEYGSIERAWVVFTEIIETTDIANIRTYNTMLKGYSTIIRNDGEIISYSRPRLAEQLLDRMEMSYHRETSDIVPDKYSYTTVISAYGRSNVKRKAAKAHWVLQRMIDANDDGNNSAKPNTYAFNAVLNACAHTRYPEEKVEAFTILCSTLILQRKWAKPDHTTYGIFLQGCSRLLPKNETRKWRVVETVFNSCTKEGQCGNLVLSTLKQQPELYEALVGRFLTDDGLEIPLQWRRNIAGRKDGAASQ